MFDAEKAKRKGKPKRWVRWLFIAILLALSALYVSFVLEQLSPPSEFEILSSQIAAATNCPNILRLEHGTPISLCGSDKNLSAYMTYTPHP